MAISNDQKIDYLWKKIGYGRAKTDTAAIKDAVNESISSALLLRGDNVWAQSNLIPATIPGSSTSVVTLYPTSLPVECTADTTSSTNRTWKTNITDWIPPEIGSTYLVKVYVHTSGNAATAAASGTQLVAAGSGNNDEWFFDYQSGTLNFIGTNLPSGVNFTGKSVYISGAVYSGIKGVAPVGAANTFTDINLTGNLSVTGVSTFVGGIRGIGIQSGSVNVTTGIITALNFVGAGNSISYNAGTKTVDISIGGGNWEYENPSNTYFSDIYRLNGNVGLGTINPTAKLDVHGNAIITGIVTGGLFVGDGSGLTGVVAAGTGVEVRDDTTLIGVASVFDYGPNLSVVFSAGIATITATGGTASQWVSTAAGIHTLSNVGIGSTIPTSALTVAGSGTSTSQLYVTGVSTFIGGVFANDIYVGDYDRIFFGNNANLAIGYDTANVESLIRNQTSAPFAIDLGSNSNSKLSIRTGFASTLAYFSRTNVELYESFNKKFETIGAGVTVTGTTFTNQLNVSGVSTSSGYNATTGTDYKINGTSVLDATTLGSGVVNSSLTSVGTLTSLNVSGTTTLAGIATVTGTTLFSRQLSVSGIVTTGTLNLITGNTYQIAGVNVLSATTLGANVVNSSLTSVGTLSAGLNIASGQTYRVNGTNVLTATTLGSGVVNSSLTSVGTLTSLNVSGTTTANSFVKTGGTSNQFLKADGSIDSNTYLTTTTISISDDTTTNSTRYPLFSDVSTGTPTATYASSTKLNFNPSTGTLSATQFTSLSDKTQKTNIRLIDNSIELVKQLEGVRYDWINNQKPSIGVIAQDIEKVLPEVVETNSNGLKSVSYGNIVGVLIEAIKEQQIRIEELEKKLNA